MDAGLEKRLQTFLWDLKRRNVTGSYAVALETANILKIAISCSNGMATQMMERVKAIGEQLIDAAPLELGIGNCMRRVLHIVREEYDLFAADMKGEEGGQEARVFVQVGRPFFSSSSSYFFNIFFFFLCVC